MSIERMAGLHLALHTIDRDRVDSLDSATTQLPKGTVNMVVDLIKTALATEPTALDVERLALAICVSQERCDGTCPDFEGVGAIHLHDAKAFAAAYERRSGDETP